MMTYTRKPQTIEAYQWTGAEDQPIPPWAASALREGRADFTQGPSLRITTHRDGRPMISVWNLGDQVVSNYMPGCWIMRMPAGRFEREGYVKIMLEDDFHALYEPA